MRVQGKLQSQAGLVAAPASLLQSSVTLDRLISLSEPPFSHLQNEG